MANNRLWWAKRFSRSMFGFTITGPYLPASLERRNCFDCVLALFLASFNGWHFACRLIERAHQQLQVEPLDKQSHYLFQSFRQVASAYVKIRGQVSGAGSPRRDLFRFFFILKPQLNEMGSCDVWGIRQKMLFLICK